MKVGIILLGFIVCFVTGFMAAKAVEIEGANTMIKYYAVGGSIAAAILLAIFKGFNSTRKQPS